MSVTFYYNPFSTAALTLWELTELGVNYEKVKLDLGDKRDQVGSSRVDLQACKLEYSIVSPK